MDRLAVGSDLGWNEPVAIAVDHRGDPIGERENTFAAFSAAARQGADMIELDLRRTGDGVIFVLHDSARDQSEGGGVLEPMFRLVTRGRVDAVHWLGVKVSTWTVDEPRHLARIVDAGVDAVVSNRIAELRTFIALEVP